MVLGKTTDVVDPCINVEVFRTVLSAIDEVISKCSVVKLGVARTELSKTGLC